MAGEDISNAELARQIAAMQRDIHDDLSEIRRRQDAYVLREVYLSDQRGSEARMLAIERDLAALRLALTTAEEKRETAARADVDRRAADRRLVVGAVISAVLALIVQVILSMRGPV
ncbi:hypothetical protein [Micromonospora sp. NPDC023633]|uniref:hypothetical protein n=1 Tax=Micromonospora sp. NPDC023633 TaxID=3154320 RepID=UPI0033EBA193